MEKTRVDECLTFHAGRFGVLNSEDLVGQLFSGLDEGAHVARIEGDAAERVLLHPHVHPKVAFVFGPSPTFVGFTAFVGSLSGFQALDLGQVAGNHPGDLPAVPNPSVGSPTAAHRSGCVVFAIALLEGWD